MATYIEQLKLVAESCNLGDAAHVNEMLRNHLLCRITNEKWQQQLLVDDGLIYEKATQFLLSFDVAEQGLKDLSVDTLTLTRREIRSIFLHTSREIACDSCRRMISLHTWMLFEGLELHPTFAHSVEAMPQEALRGVGNPWSVSTNT